MKTTRFFLGALCGALIPGAAQAELAFERKLIELTISHTETELNVTFPFTVKGDRPVKILSLDPGCCSCTTAKVAKTTWEPGEKGEIALRFEPGNREGLQRQGVVIKTDDPKKPFDSVALVANISKTLELPQPYIDWKKGEPLKPKTMSVKAVPGVQISEVKATVAGAQIRVDVQRDGDVFAIKVTPSPNVRNIREAVTLDAILGGGRTKRSMLYVLIP